MSGVDVRKLAGENLPYAEFPASAESKFRLHLHPDVHQGIQQHAKADVSVEICGVLVGRWKQDEQGPYADAQDYIRCDNASSKFAEVTFTHESWSQINQEMDSKYDDSRILGWYHSHPDFGIFLSDRDCFIQENFFSGAGQVAYVVDPVRDLEGLFAWGNGKPELLPHYWIGENICTSHASLRSSKTEQTAYGANNNSAGSELAEGEGYRQFASPTEPSPLPLAMQMLAWTAIFLLGYLLAGWRTSWERQRVIEGVVAHYGVDKVLKLGLEENLVDVQSRLRAISEAFQNLPTSSEGLTEEEMEALSEQRILITKNLDFLESSLESIGQQFGFSEEERAAIFRLVAQKHAELRKLRQELLKAEDKKAKAENKADQPNDSKQDDQKSTQETKSVDQEISTPNPDAADESLGREMLTNNEHLESVER